jgi:hypothetical protein
MASSPQSTPSMAKFCKASRLGQRSRHECENRPTRLNLPRIRRFPQPSWRLPSRPKMVPRLRKVTLYQLAARASAAALASDVSLTIDRRIPGMTGVPSVAIGTIIG